jgi:hypothetical protein
MSEARLAVGEASGRDVSTDFDSFARNLVCEIEQTGGAR